MCASLMHPVYDLPLLLECKLPEGRDFCVFFFGVFLCLFVFLSEMGHSDHPQGLEANLMYSRDLIYTC